jgi:hypothetical protein
VISSQPMCDASVMMKRWVHQQIMGCASCGPVIHQAYSLEMNQLIVKLCFIKVVSPMPCQVFNAMVLATICWQGLCSSSYLQHELFMPLYLRT